LDDWWERQERLKRLYNIAHPPKSERAKRLLK